MFFHSNNRTDHEYVIPRRELCLHAMRREKNQNYSPRAVDGALKERKLFPGYSIGKSRSVGHRSMQTIIHFVN